MCTGTLFGCLAEHKALKECRWDYDTYTCGVCSKDTSTLDLPYNVVYPDDEEWDYWTNRYENMAENATWSTLQMGLCGVQPTSSYSNMVPSTHEECNSFRVCSHTLWLYSVVILCSDTLLWDSLLLTLWLHCIPLLIHTNTGCLYTTYYAQTNVKPSIGNDGKFCVCVKPHDSYEGDTYAVTEADFEAYETLYNDVCWQFVFCFILFLSSFSH